MSHVSAPQTTALLASLFVWAFAAQGLADTVNGQEFVSMENWEPGNFLVSCGPETGTLSPSSLSQGCLGRNSAEALEFEVAAISALDYLQKQGFESPYHFGPVVNIGTLSEIAQGDGEEAIRIFTNVDPSAYAYVDRLTGPATEECDRESYRIMSISPAAFIGEKSHQISMVAAHELFHAIEHSIPGASLETPNRPDACLPDDWITEGMADTIGVDFMRREYPAAFPPSPKDQHAENYAGLRPYNASLHRPPDDDAAYGTGSFWLYLGDRFHNSNFAYLSRYLSVSPPTYASASGPADDWLHWLDERLRWDDEIQTPLHFVYPRFLTYFASDYSDGGVGEKFNSRLWIGGSFTCKTVTLSPQNNYVELDFELQKMAGECLVVIVEGIEPSDLVSIKIGALTKDIETADALHLGFGATTDATGFNCAAATRAGRLPSNVESCLIEPWTGEFLDPAGNTPAARLWYASSLESGTMPQTLGPKSQLANMYILSHVPVEPWQSRLDGQPPVEIKLGIGLDWASLSVDGENVNSGQNDGTRSAARRRAAAALGLYPVETDRMIPATIGDIDIGGVGRIFESFINRSNPEMSLNKLLEAQSGVSFGTELVSFRLADTEVIPITEPIPEETLEIVREFLVMIEDVIPVGTTGTFKGTIQGSDRNNPDLLYYSPVPAQVEILENSHGAFRARADGIVCEMDLSPLKLMLGNVNKCRRSFFVSGEIAKPFAYLYRPDTELTSIETEGERYYDRYNSARGSFSGSGPTSREVSESDDTQVGNSSGSGIQCQCECPNIAIPASNRCVGQCYAKLQTCEAVDTTSVGNISVEKLTELLRDLNLPQPAQDMLISDFSTMSEETKARVIELYQN